MPNARREPALWRNLSFTLMWTSTAASGFGDRMIMLAGVALLGGLAATGDATSINAGTQFWFFLAYIFFSIPGGWLADHLPRKWLMFACDEVRGLILLVSFFAVATASGPADIPADHHWKVFAALFAIGTFASVFNPTRNAIIPQIVPRTKLQAGNAIILVINVIASQVGLLVGKELIDPAQATSVRTGLLVGSAFYLVSGWFFAFLKPIETVTSRDEATVHRRSLRQAARYITHHRRAAILIGLNVLIWSSAAVVTSAVFGLGKAHFSLEGDALLAHYAYVNATLGGGMLIGAAIVTIIGTRRESPLVYLTAFMLAGVSILLMVAVPAKWATYIGALGVGVFGNICIVAVMSLLQSITPNYMRGRVMGLNSLTNTFFSVTTYGLIWQMPRADENIGMVMFILGPALIIIGGWNLLRYAGTGPLSSRSLNALWRIIRLFAFAWHGLKVEGKHNIPATGAVLLAANHTAGIDPHVLQSASLRMIRWVMVDLYHYAAFNFIWNRIEPIVISNEGAELTKVRQIIKALKRDEIVGLFPEGRLQRAVRELQPFRAGIGMIAQRSGAWIVPTWIEGTPQVHSMVGHFLLPSRTRIRFGKPYKADPNATNLEIVEDLRLRMVALANDVASS